MLRLVSFLCLLTLSACVEFTRDPVPTPLISMAQPVGFADVRAWGDRNDADTIDALMAQRAAAIRKRLDLRGGGRIRYLALSGGGQYGAFSAGLLTQWTQSGTRPDFDGVSGISTGAIIAPFAFLGPDYDAALTEIYTTLETRDVATPRVLSGLLGGSSLADTAPLQQKIASFVTRDFLDRIAEEYAKGRMLLVGTTNLDAGRPVIWDMGAIAASRHPGAVDLFRDVILASAAIPIAFPPVRFRVQVDGRVYDELHVDGGVTSQVSILSPQIPLADLDRRVGRSYGRDLYVVVNGSTQPIPAPVKPTIPGIGTASLDAIWYAQTTGDLYKIYTSAQRDQVRVRYAWIPTSFTDEPDEQFDPVFMRKLYGLGQALIRNDQAWSRYPPNFNPG